MDAGSSRVFAGSVENARPATPTTTYAKAVRCLRCKKKPGLSMAWMQYDESGDAVGPLCAADGKLWRGPFALF